MSAREDLTRWRFLFLHSLLLSEQMNTRLFWVIPLLACGAHAGLRILSDSPSNETIYCTSMSRFLGPQPGEVSPVIAQLHYLIADPCDSESITRHEAQNKAVIVPSSGCPEEDVYYALAAKGASAVIRTTTFQPGLPYNVRALHKKVSSRTDMLYVEVPPGTFQDDFRFEGVMVSISLDPNIWLPYFESWQWQTFLRWLPGAIYCLGAVLALMFLLIRFYDDCERYYQQTPKSLQVHKEAFRYGLTRLNLTHLALAIEVFKCPIMAFVCMVCGLYSTPNLPDQVQRFFVSQLSGITFLTTMISARTWHRAVHRHTRGDSLLARVLGDSTHSHIFAALTLAPFLSDLLISVLYVMYIPNRYPILDIVSGGIFFVLKLLTGSLFLHQSLSFLYHSYKNASALEMYAQHQDSDVKRQLVYQMLYALGVGISSATYISGTLVIVLACPYFSYPQGFLLAFSLMTVGLAMETFFHIMIFRPSPKSAMLKLISMSKQVAVDLRPSTQNQ